MIPVTSAIFRGCVGGVSAAAESDLDPLFSDAIDGFFGFLVSGSGFRGGVTRRRVLCLNRDCDGD